MTDQPSNKGPESEDAFPLSGELASILDESFDPHEIFGQSFALHLTALKWDTLGLLECQAAGKLGGCQRISDNLLKMIELGSARIQHLPNELAKAAENQLSKLVNIVKKCAESGISIEGSQLGQQQNRQGWLGWTTGR